MFRDFILHRRETIEFGISVSSGCMVANKHFDASKVLHSFDSADNFQAALSHYGHAIGIAKQTRSFKNLTVGKVLVSKA